MGEHNNIGRRVLGLLDGKALFEPNNSASSLTFAAAGGGKTTCVAMPTIMSLLGDKNRALMINDVKNGEITHQIADMCIKYGRKFAAVDDAYVMGADYPYRISLNAFGSSITTAKQAPEYLGFVSENQSYALIEEPSGNDAKNFYFRDVPRKMFIELGQRVLINRSERLCTPGGLTALLNDPQTWVSALEIEAEEGDDYTRGFARHTLEMREYNPEHYAQHLQAALSALNIYASGSVLHSSGTDATHTHEELIRDNWVVCFVNPARYADRMGPHFALQTLALMEAQLKGDVGKCDYILDEYCNAPLKNLLNKITIFRSLGARAHFITQSRQDSVRKYGERETALLEENCTVKQWLKFSNFEEAERVSKAMGETHARQSSLNLNSKDTNFSGGLNLGKQRLFTANELMMLPGDEQIIHVADVGFIHAKKIGQHQIAPYAHDLAPNPLEGGRLTPDIRVSLKSAMRNGRPL
ncbi:MAG: TraM recognition domain-containing protein [Pseudomonadota bacterium]